MAEADWTEFTTNALGSGDVSRGVTAGFTRAHAECGSFVFGYHSLTTASGIAGLYVDLTNFAPIASGKGASIRGLMKRYSSGILYCPMMGIINSTDPSSGNGYLIGLTQATSYHIAVRKGAPSAGMNPSSAEIVQQSTDAYTASGDANTTWLHLRMDILVNPHSEVVINVYKNDAVVNGVLSPVWTAITGMTQFIDDSLGILTGSAPHTGGFYAFFGMYTNGVAGNVALFDHMEVHRQTSP